MGLKSQNSPIELQKNNDLANELAPEFGTTLNSLGITAYSFERHTYIDEEKTKQITITKNKISGTETIEIKDLTKKKATKKEKKLIKSATEAVKTVAEVVGRYHGAYDKARGN